uniref:TRIM8/14/16/25/29/45/65 coiled-coil region domain-containing protein n=1 Tax=Felis catus TaxID=9685 RepID=A0ABI7XBY9_FELCA
GGLPGPPARSSHGGELEELLRGGAHLPHLPACLRGAGAIAVQTQLLSGLHWRGVGQGQRPGALPGVQPGLQPEAGPGEEPEAHQHRREVQRPARGPPLPAQKVCLRCEAPCCQSHVQTHLQQPSTARGHLLVEADDVRAWSCPQHNAYRLYHCEAEQVAVCQYCCYYSGAHQGHSVCDVEIRRNEIRKMLMKQQDRLEEREQDIEDQLYKLESDKRLVEEKVSQLKEEVRLQYEKLHQLLDEDLRQTVEVLDKAQAKFCSENAAQALHLGERMQEAKKLLGSLQLLFDKTEDVSFMKNTKSVKILMDRTQTCTGSSLSPPKIGHLNSKLFLNEVAKKEKQLRKMLEGEGGILNGKERALWAGVNARAFSLRGSMA